MRVTIARCEHVDKLNHPGMGSVIHELKDGKKWCSACGEVKA